MREAVGALLWVSTMTRPNITSALRAMARYAHTPAESLWKSKRMILSYLNGKESRHYVCAGIGSWGLNPSVCLPADADYDTQTKQMT